MNVISNFILNLPQFEGRNINPDVTILVHKPLNIISKETSNFEITIGDNLEIVVDIVNVAIFKLLEKNQINIYPYDDLVHFNEIQLHLLGNVFALIILREGRFILHGSCVQLSNQSVVFTGDSGAGKSTMARGCIHRGYQLISDDLSVISETKEIIPGYPSQKLWEDVVDKYTLVKSDENRIFLRNNKFSVESTEHFCTRPIKLSAVVELLPVDIDKPRLEELSSTDSLEVLLKNTYRGEFNILFNSGLKHFVFMTKLLEDVRVFRIYRPIKIFSVDEQIDLLIEKLVT
jgi:hypothetical protein